MTNNAMVKIVEENEDLWVGLLHEYEEDPYFFIQSQDEVQRLNEEYGREYSYYIMEFEPTTDCAAALFGAYSCDLNADVYLVIEYEP